MIDFNNHKYQVKKFIEEKFDKYQNIDIFSITGADNTNITFGGGGSYSANYVSIYVLYTYPTDAGYDYNGVSISYNEINKYIIDSRDKSIITILD